MKIIVKLQAFVITKMHALSHLTFLLLLTCTSHYSPKVFFYFCAIYLVFLDFPLLHFPFPSLILKSFSMKLSLIAQVTFDFTLLWTPTAFTAWYNTRILALIKGFFLLFICFIDCYLLFWHLIFEQLDDYLFFLSAGIISYKHFLLFLFLDWFWLDSLWAP